MRVRLLISRKERGADAFDIEEVLYETSDENATVASALTELNAERELSRPIEWEHSCHQKKCGACAMLLNGYPGLACDCFLKRFDGKTLSLSPLKKFPVIADLLVDRSILSENLKQMRVWLNDKASLPEKKQELAHEASRCLQCGCCLEVCPNFCPGEEFSGLAGFVPTARLIAELPESQKKELFRIYRNRFYEGCGKSLACRKVCPAGLDVDRLLVNTNAAAVWKRR